MSTANEKSGKHKTYYPLIGDKDPYFFYPDEEDSAAEYSLNLKALSFTDPLVMVQIIHSLATRLAVCRCGGEDDTSVIEWYLTDSDERCAVENDRSMLLSDVISLVEIMMSVGDY